MLKHAQSAKTYFKGNRQITIMKLDVYNKLIAKME